MNKIKYKKQVQYVIFDMICGSYLKKFSDNEPWGEWLEDDGFHAVKDYNIVYGHNSDESFTFVKEPMTFETIEQAQLIVDKMLNAIRDGEWDDVEDCEGFSEDQVCFTILEAKTGYYVCLIER